MLNEASSQMLIRSTLMPRHKEHQLGECVPFSDLPKVSIDYRGLSEYIRTNNRIGTELDDDELALFVHGDADWKAYRDSFIINTPADRKP